MITMMAFFINKEMTHLEKSPEESGAIGGLKQHLD